MLFETTSSTRQDALLRWVQVLRFLILEQLMNCYNSEVEWIEKTCLTVWESMGVQWKEKWKCLSFFPAVIPTFIILSTLPVTGFIIQAVHVFFKQSVLWNTLLWSMYQLLCRNSSILSAGLSVFYCHQICFLKSLPSPMHCLLCYHITAVDGSLKVLCCCYVQVHGVGKMFCFS